MASQVITVDAEQLVSEVAVIMIDNDIHRVFIIEDEKIVGVISAFPQ